MTLHEKLSEVEAKVSAMLTLVQTENKLLKEGSKTEAAELNKAIKNACLQLLKTLAETEAALLEEEEEQPYPLLE